jgi:PilZ domain
MSPEISIVVADVSRVSAIRGRVQLPGRAMDFTSGNLASAMDSIRAHRPSVVAVDALFADTAAGAAFIDRVNGLALPGTAVRLIAQHDGRWITTPWRGLNSVGAEQTIVPPPPLTIAAAVAAQIGPANTRRAPRFLVQHPVDALVENSRASLVDISVLGAQIVSQPVLRPNQKIKVGLPDTNETLNVVAHVAWSTYERPRSDAEPHYRAGIEFTSAAQQVLEDYRRRHCADEPIPLRSR